MLRIYSNGAFRNVSATDKGIAKFYRSLTDERFVLDVVAPGFTKDDITVELSPNKKSLKVTLIPTGRPPFDVDGDPDNFGYNGVKMKAGTMVNTFAIDCVKYDLSTLKVEAHAGVIRIAALKVAKPWIGIRIRGIA